MNNEKDDYERSTPMVALITAFIVLFGVTTGGALYYAAITKGAPDRYFGTQAGADFRLRDEQIRDLMERVRNLEILVEHIQQPEE